MAKASRKAFVEGTIRPGWFAPLAALLVLTAVAGVLAGYNGLGKDPPDTLLGWGGIGAFVVAAAVVALLGVATKRQLRVDLKGIEMRVGLGKPVHIKWEEPHDYYYRAVTGSSTPAVEKASVRTADGRQIDVDDYKFADFPNVNVPALVERYSTSANLPKIKQRLEAGEEVAFGALRLSSDQMQFEDHNVSVEKGVVLNIEDGRIRVGVEGDWISSKVSAREVANYPCLLRVIGQVTHARSPT